MNESRFAPGILGPRLLLFLLQCSEQNYVVSWLGNANDHRNTTDTHIGLYPGVQKIQLQDINLV